MGIKNRSLKRSRRHLGLESLEQRHLLAATINEVLTSNGDDLSTRVRISTDTPFVSLPINPDWIELGNSSGTPFDLSGYHLTDNDERPTRWEFPAGTTIPANGYLVVFASGENTNDPGLDESGRLHANFQLSSGGEYLALTDPSGNVVDELDIPKMRRNVSFGVDAQNSWGYYMDTTPGATNSTQTQFVADTTFDNDRGLYFEPFQVAIATATEGATIVYTLDGTKPSVDSSNQITNGIEYTDPVNVTSTTNLRAMAFKDGMAPTNVDTQTYIFPEHVLQQSDSDIPPSANWGSSGPDWEMDPEVVNLPDGDTNKPLIDDFSELPTVSITWNWDDLFGDQGIYLVGEHIEKEISFEYFDPVSGEGTQQNASIEIQGGSSVTSPRNWKTDKISMLLRFKDPYGPTTLNHDVFGEGSTTVFDQMTIDGQLNFVWDYGNNNTQRSQALYIHDQVAADVQNEISGEGSAPHGRFAHVYHNGVYWGMHYLHERPDESFGAQYWGGDKEEYHALNQNRSISNAINPDGSPTPPNEAVNDLNAADALARAAGTGGLEEWNRVNEEIDVEHFIDYLMMNWYLGNEDWGAENKNWYATRRNTPDGRWRFHSWDAEKVFQNFASGGVDKVGEGPKGLHSDLMGNEEYELLFADRIQDLMFNGGVLTEESLAPIFQFRVDEVEAASRLESARWGDNRVSNPYMREHLVNNFQSVFDNFFPDRHERVLEDLIAEGVYPEISAPMFQINGTDQHGGPITLGDTLTMTASAATVTTDTVLITKDADVKAFVPSDGSLETGATRWYDTDFDDSTWTAGSGVVGFGSDFTSRVQLDMQDQWNANNQSSVYVRYEFDLDEGFNAADIDRLNLEIKNDDGYVLYVNGQEIHSDGAPDSADWNSRATATQTNFVHRIVDRYISVDLAAGISALQPGKNVVAIRGLAHTSDLDHLLVGAELTMSDDVAVAAPIVYTLDGSDPRVPGDANVGITYDGEIPLMDSTEVQARAFVNGQWSALSATTFTIPADPGDVWITEINYNPHQPTDAEMLVIPDVQKEDFEFIEVYNANPLESINLLGMELSNGVTFTFPEFNLEPQSHAVVVEDIAAFELRYGTSVDVIGQWSGSLSDRGEAIELVDGGGNRLAEIGYDDTDPWAARADGIGATLEFVEGDAFADTTRMGKHYNWQASSNVGGTPGAAGSTQSSVVINEVRASSNDEAGEVDAIELYNSAGTGVDISGWFLSDSSQDLFQFEIPAGTVIPGESYLTFTEADFNPGGNGFALRSAGDDVWLVTQNEQGGIGQFIDDVHFGATANSETLGRIPNITGRLAPLAVSSLGSANGAARVGPIVISEVQYNPGEPSEAALAANPDADSGDLEFVEIHNPTAASLDLTNWRLRGGVDLDFDEGTMLPAGASLVAISFNPDNPNNAARVAAFRAHYDISDTVRLVGGFGGQLNNGGERVQLQRPGTPPMDEPDLTPRLYEDEVLFDDLAPWPASADGTGSSLTRRSATSFGNDANSWTAADPSPGVFNLDAPVGDLNGDGAVDGSDVDVVCNAIGGPFMPNLDFQANGEIDFQDVEAFVQGPLGTHMGDANLDGRVDAGDLNQVGIHWLQDDNVGWGSGDFNCDGEVSAGDLNIVGINWLEGAPQQAARAPRAPLAANASVGIPAIELNRVDAASDASATNRDLGIQTSDDHSDDQVDNLKRRQRDNRIGRRYRSVAADATVHTQAELSYADAADQLFAGFDRLQ